MRITTNSLVLATLLAPIAGGCTVEQTEPAEPVESESAALIPLIDAGVCPSLGSCTANDVVTEVISAQEIGGDDCADGYLDVEWTVAFSSTANQRYNLGFYVSPEGTPVSGATPCLGIAPQVGDGEADRYPDPDSDLFLNLDGDSCGDLSGPAGPVQLDVSATVACTDVTPTGLLTVQSCRVWEHNGNHPACSGSTAPGTGSKCDCDPIVLQVDPCSLIICNDGLFCNGEETCDSSTGVAVCQPGTPPNCDDGVSCTDDSCNEELDQCDNTPNTGNCDDGLFCNGDEICDPTSPSADPTTGCVPGTAVVCGDVDGLTCTDEACNEASDSCEATDNGECQALPPPSSSCTCACPI